MVAGGAAGGGGAGGAAGHAGSGGATGSGPNPIDPDAPCPKCVNIFDGTSFEHWEAAPSTWELSEGAMRGEGGTSRAAYTKQDYGNVRLIVTSRMNPVNGDHLGILFWGNRPDDPDSPQIDGAGWLQWMPPSGTMWSYHPPMHHYVEGMEVGDVEVSDTEWHTSELLLNLDMGTLRAAVNGVEITRYTHPWPTERDDPETRIIAGPLAMMRHGGGGSEYKDIWVEANPTEDVLYTVE